MSLINNMLKDLEHREGKTPTIAYLPFRRLQRQTHLWIGLCQGIGALIALILITFVIHHLFFKHRIKPLAFLQERTANTLSLAHPIDTDWRQSINITGMTVQNKDNLTEMTFLLDKEALYRLDSDEMQNQLVVYIDRSQLKAEVPALNLNNKAFANITSSRNANGDTKFIITLAPGATLKYVNQNTVNGHPELVIAAILSESAQVSAKSQRADTTVFPTEPDNGVKSPTVENVLAQQYQAALLNAESGHYELAISNLKALLKMDSNYQDARVSLVALLIDQNKVAEAQNLINIGIEHNPSFIPFIELKARVYASQHQYKQALSTLRANMPPLEENLEYHAFIAAMYEQNNQHSLAANLYKRLLGMNNNNSSWWFGLGVSLDKMGQSKNAVSAYKEAAKHGHLTHESQSYLRDRLHQLQEAIDDKE